MGGSQLPESWRLSGLLAAHALKLFLGLLNGYELAGLLTSLRPGPSELVLKLRALADSTLSGIVSGRFVRSHQRINISKMITLIGTPSSHRMTGIVASLFSSED